MNETQSTILSEIQKASNKVHQQTMRGTADVIFVSRRVMDEIEDVLDEEAFQHHVIVEASGFVGELAPCDIRAMAQMGHTEIQYHESEHSGLLDEQIQEIVDNPENDIDSKKEFEEQYGTLEIPEIEFDKSGQEWIETYDITLDDKMFQQ